MSKPTELDELIEILNERTLIFLGACLLLRDPDDQFTRRDSVAREAAERAIGASKFLLDMVKDLSR